jgi:phytoene dehydrogenase-like protein
MSKIGIVGSGMGSLGFAIRSAVAGHQVTVFEANSYPGGKLAQIETNWAFALMPAPPFSRCRN